MKIKKTTALIMAFLVTVNFFIVGTFQSSAHEAMLNVDYDDCVMGKNTDGIDEMWYVLTRKGECRHYPDNMSTIKYYFEESSNNYTWTTEVSETIAQEIKDAFANSMKKWNNVYFYSYNSDGTVEKHKIINVVEGTESDHNLSIFPAPYNEKYSASTNVDSSANTIENGSIKHNHYSKWKMNVSIPCFYVHDGYSEEFVDIRRKTTGAHELGHVLGLRDLDIENLCRANNPNDQEHHEEAIMGYGDISFCTTNIQYKDIAGVAITRGFHTDEDHIWLNCGRQSDLKFKLICSVCNAVKTLGSIVTSLYDTYGACNNAHNLSSGNMMAVASYGTRDYHKCKYCRYIASYNSTIAQNYSKTDYSDSKHKCVNTVPGLSYTFYENHRVTSYVPCDSDIYHNGVCGGCGHYSPSKHIVTPTAGKFATCIMCGASVRVGNGTISPWGNNGVTVASVFNIGGRYITENGSYILPTGVIVLVEEDVEAYLNGELILPDDLP